MRIYFIQIKENGFWKQASLPYSDLKTISEIFNKIWLPKYKWNNVRISSKTI